ncbi:HAD-like domain-containing protein [Absidia repens]|uniref:phosphoserine phosphatase n=1 Tax=Absidia repens TaxID=90262 RepID=A0A1X2J1Q6_9FUNG|nr:HAD-like domain-containing protein [Absidia repens]
MKFGKYLEDRKSYLPNDYASNCIDYTRLKQLLKDTVYANSIKIDPTREQQQPFSQVVSQRLSQLQTCEVHFIEQLDIQVTKVCDFFQQESTRIVKETNNDQSTPTDLLQKILTLERFVFLNYTGITKILKKNDRHSGLALSEPYLHRVAQLPLVKAEDLSQLKQNAMNKLQQQLHSTGEEQQQHDANMMIHHPLGLSPPMIRSRSHYKFTSNAALPPTFVGPNQKVLVSLSGPHGTDIVGAVLECLARHPCAIEDFMLSRLYHNVTFGVLITLQSDNVTVFRDLAEAAQQWDATLTFDVPDTQATEPTIRHRGEKKNKTTITTANASQSDDDQIYLPASLEEAPYSGRIKYAASILNQNGLEAGFLSQCTQLLLKHHISVEKLSRLDKRHTLSCADLRLSVPTTVNMDTLRKELIDLAASFGSDVALQPDDVFRKNKRLVVFDMDSTLIQQEVIDEIARYAGVVDQVATITEAAMNGEIDFKESLRRRVALLNGTSVSVIEDVKKILTFTEGARFLCHALKKLGFKLAVISGGFMPLALYVKSELGLDYAFANQLEVSSDGLTLTGETTGPIVDGIRKAELLEVIAQSEGVTLNQVIAVGDGANDLWMMNKAGLGIAFNAKPRVQEQARARINQKSLKYVLSLLGYSEQDMEQLGAGVE